MKFTNVQSTEDGLKFDVETSSQEATYLINFAVERLLQEGILSINDCVGTQEVQLRETAH